MSIEENYVLEKEKDIDEEFIEQLLHHIETEDMSQKEKLIYLKKVINYLNMKIKLYKDLGIDASIGMFLIGIGIGNGIGANEDFYLTIILCSFGVGSMLFSAIKRNFKFNNESNELKNEELKILRKKT